MDNQPLPTGTLVVIKDLPRINSFSFIWDSTMIDGERWIIVNTTTDLITSEQLPEVKDKERFALFPRLNYAFVKPYEILRSNEGALESFTEDFRNVITHRRDMGKAGEFLFYAMQDTLISRGKVYNELLPDLIERYFSDKYSLIADEAATTQIKEGQIKMKALVILQLHLEVSMFFMYKQVKTNLDILGEIKIDDNRSFLQTLREDKDLLDSFLELVTNKNLFTKGAFYPKDSNTKTIVYGLNESLYKLIGPEVSRYQEIVSNSWQNHTGASGPFAFLENFDFSKFIIGLYDNNLTELQKLMFKDLGQSPIINKKVKGKRSVDYNLAFYIPIFQWLLPELFPLKIKDITPVDLRKLHIRRIKEFISGKSMASRL